VVELIKRGLVEPARLRELFNVIEPELFRHPAIDPPTYSFTVRRSWTATTTTANATLPSVGGCFGDRLRRLGNEPALWRDSTVGRGDPGRGGGGVGAPW
jgi:hypothetical protein